MSFFETLATFCENAAGALSQRRRSRYSDDQLWSMRQLGIDADDLTDDQITQALADINGREYHRDADDYTPDRWADPDPYRDAAEQNPYHWRNHFDTLDEAKAQATWLDDYYRNGGGGFGTPTRPVWYDSFLADEAAEGGWSL